MFRLDGQWVFSATDLVAQLGCDHSTSLQLAEKAGLVSFEETPADPMAQLAGKHGEAHERRVLQQLKSQGLRVVEIALPQQRDKVSIEAARDATLAAMRSGADVVYQAVFFDGEFYGLADFVMLVSGDEDAGFQYEVWDSKLARSAKPSALLQLAAYSDQVEQAGFGRPGNMHVWLGTGEHSHHSVDDVMPVLVATREALRRKLATEPHVPEPLWADRRAACGLCRYAAVCDDGRSEARDLSLVYNIHPTHRRKLTDAGITTIEALAACPDDARPRDLSSTVFERLRSQARLQVSQDATRTEANPDGDVSHEVFSNDGFALLPRSSPGDLWFDMEGDPFAEQGRGLEYLFGAVTLVGDDLAFSPWWGHTVADEKAAFQGFVDFVEQRRSQWPDLHVYHYAAYERTALRRLAATHGTREQVIDDWLRTGVLVDLFTVVTGSIRVSQRSYSIKKLEPLYGRTRTEGVTTAGDSVKDYEDYLDLRDSGDSEAGQAKLDGIAAYNEVDCASTYELDRWLRGCAGQAGRSGERPTGSDSPSGQDVTPADSSESRVGAPDVGESEHPDDAALVASLLAHVPVDGQDRDAEQRGRAMLAAALGFHRREVKPFWWEHYSRVDAPVEQLESEDDVVVVQAIDVGPWELKSKRKTRQLTLQYDPEDDVQLKAGGSVNLLHAESVDGMSTGSAVARGRGWTSATVSAVEPGQLLVVESVPMGCEPSDGPIAVLPGFPPQTTQLHQCITAAAGRACDGPWPQGPAYDVLARKAPRLTKQTSLPRIGDDTLDVTTAVRDLNNSYLAVQGPPGTGKTYVGALVVKALVEDGWRVGVVAQSHAVVENFLDATLDAGLSADRIGKKDARRSSAPWARTPGAFTKLYPQAGVLIGGTAWTFCTKLSLEHPLDLLVIDEAGQFSLANTVAVAEASRNLLLLGDPAQLPQVSQGTHPEPVDTSALGWLMGENQVLPADFGYFLATTYRMHPEVCSPVSRLSYRNRLHSHPRTAARHLEGLAPGIESVAVRHHDRQTHSPEEVDVVVELAINVLGRAWSDETGASHIGQDDVLIVSPYNRQVNAIKAALDTHGLVGVRVGTVDKFQGQEAPVVIMSMAASSLEDAPRGADFLLSRNRLNVALSRAKWKAYLVQNPELTNHSPTTVHQLELLGGFLGVTSDMRKERDKW